MTRIFHSIANHFISAVSYFALLLVTVVAPYRDMIIGIIILALIDFFIAVLNAIIWHVLESNKITKLVIKLSAYLIIFLIVGITKHIYDIDLLEWAFIPIMVMREVHSIMGNLVILCPKLKTFKILMDILDREIEVKTNNIKQNTKNNNGKEDSRNPTEEDVE